MRYAMDTVKINSELLDRDLRATKISLAKISETILGKGHTYLGNCLGKGCISESILMTLCDFFGFDAKKYILDTTETKKEKATKLAAPEAVVNIDTSSLLAGLHAINETLKASLAMQTETRKKLNTLENALGKLVEGQTKMANHLDIDLDSIDDTLGKVHSDLNIVNGRLKDICNHEQKLATVAKKGE
ncbi:MAG TPA: hypothetical protein DCP07_04035 [Lachnospiraceae bacterium]|nr:hypothetical protein [Lachnospiraceae bacterium]